MVILAGILVDKLGNHIALGLFSFNCLLGSTLFAAGASLKMFELMLIGRVIFGLGNGSLTIVQNKITATWFEGKELALAFGFTMSMSRAGSVLNFNISPLVCDKIGLANTLWFGVGLTAIGLVAAVTVSYLDSTGMAILAKNTINVEPKPKFKISDVKNYPKAFWALTAALCFFYNGTCS
jgi:MFS family permease